MKPSIAAIVKFARSSFTTQIPHVSILVWVLPPILVFFFPYQVHLRLLDGLAIVFRFPQPERSRRIIVIMFCGCPNTNLTGEPLVMLGTGGVVTTYNSCGRLHAAELDTLRGPFVTINPRRLSTR